MATHSSILAWRITWTEEPGRLLSIGSQRARHDWSDLAQHTQHGHPIFNFFEDCYTVFHSSYTICISQNRAPDFWFFYILPNTCCFIFLKATILLCVRWYLIVVLICFSLMLLSIISRACWLFVYLLLRNVY